MLLSTIGCYAQESVSVPAPAQVNPEMRGFIKVDGLAITVPQFRIVLGDGKETISNSEGFFTFPLDKSSLDYYSVVICKRIKHNFDKHNTLKNISILPDKDYRFFTYHRIPGGRKWYQQEERLGKDNYVLPSSCIAVLIDPKNIQAIQPWKLELPEHVIKLPTIVLKNVLEEKKLTRVSAKSLLYSLDSTTFHESVRQTSKPREKNSKVAVSRVQ